LLPNWELKEGLYEYSVKRLSQEERLNAISRLKEIPITDDLKKFLQL